MRRVSARHWRRRNTARPKPTPVLAEIGLHPTRATEKGPGGALKADIDLDQDGNGSNRFLYDVATSGPALGVVFTF